MTIADDVITARMLEDGLRPCKCDNCGTITAFDNVGELRDLDERLTYPEGDPRCIMPAGECPECGCLTYEQGPEHDEARAVAHRKRALFDNAEALLAHVKALIGCAEPHRDRNEIRAARALVRDIEEA